VNARFVTRAIEATRRGLDYLSRTQLPSGEFATHTGPDLNLARASLYPKSVYVSTFVIHSLTYLAADPSVARIRERAADFLEAEEEENGTWNYEGRGEWRLPADLDTTCCAAAALVVLGRRPPRAFFPLLWQVVRRTESAPGGPYYTWVGVNDDRDDPVAAPFAREVDPLVNANVLFCCGLLGIDLPRTAEYLRGVVRAEAYVGRSYYCISPHFVIYALSRAHADGGTVGLAPVRPTLRDYLLTRLPPPEAGASALNLACRAAALLNLEADPNEVEPYLDRLLDTQERDGRWPIWAAWAGFPPNYDGSPALTTALALEALGKWLNRATTDGAREARAAE
jgi:hypothetical protein